MHGSNEDGTPHRRRHRPIDHNTIRAVRGLIAGAELAGSWSFSELDAIAAEYQQLQSAIPVTLSTIEKVSTVTGIPVTKIREALRGEEEDPSFVAGLVFSAMRCWQSCWEECRPAT